MQFHSPDKWYAEAGFTREVDFCVWVLEVDGLKVPPFVAHPDGDHALRAVGLSETDWLTWLERVIVARTSRPASPADLDADQRRILARPERAWQGAAGVQPILDQRWEEYLSISPVRKECERPLLNERERHQSAREVRQMWSEIRQYQDLLPPLHFITIAYRWASVDYLLPPNTALLATGPNAFDDRARSSRIRRAAAELARLQRAG